MEQLNQMLPMGSFLTHGVGCCKLILPESALVGRALIGFSPIFQIWCKAYPSGSARGLSYLDSLQR